MKRGKQGGKQDNKEEKKNRRKDEEYMLASRKGMTTGW
jgi:hypothetical protein